MCTSQQVGQLWPTILWDSVISLSNVLKELIDVIPLEWIQARRYVVSVKEEQKDYCYRLKWTVFFLSFFFLTKLSY